MSRRGSANRSAASVCWLRSSPSQIFQDAEAADGGSFRSSFSPPTSRQHGSHDPCSPISGLRKAISWRRSTLPRQPLRPHHRLLSNTLARPRDVALTSASLRTIQFWGKSMTRTVSGRRHSQSASRRSGVAERGVSPKSNLGHSNAAGATSYGAGISAQRAAARTRGRLSTCSDPRVRPCFAWLPVVVRPSCNGMRPCCGNSPCRPTSPSARGAALAPLKGPPSSPRDTRPADFTSSRPRPITTSSSMNLTMTQKVNFRSLHRPLPA